MTAVLLLTDWCHTGVVGGAPARGKPLLAGYPTNTGPPYNIHPHYQSQCQVSPCRHRGAHYFQGVHVYSGVVDTITRRVVGVKEIVSYVNNSEKAVSESGHVCRMLFHYQNVDRSGELRQDTISITGFSIILAVQRISKYNIQNLKLIFHRHFYQMWRLKTIK